MSRRGPNIFNNPEVSIFMRMNPITLEKILLWNFIHEKNNSNSGTKSNNNDINMVTDYEKVGNH